MAFIYKITNKITNKIYIGETTNSLEKRWDRHIYESFHQGHGYNYHLHCAIRKYGVDNFLFESLEWCEDDCRFDREHYYIMQYNSLEPNGYNYLASGRGSIKVPIEYILEEWYNGLNTVQIGEKLGLDRQTVSSHLKNYGISQEDINKRRNIQTSLRCSRPVLQYDLEGNFIKEWPSASSVKDNGYNQSLVSSVCRKECITGYGCLWKYKDDPSPIQDWIDLNTNRKESGRPKKPIIQFDNNHNFIAEYPSAADAAKALNKTDKSNICTAARKHTRAYGYYWEYKN